MLPETIECVIAELDSAIRWQALKRKGLFKNRLHFCIRWLSFYFALHGRAATYFFCLTKKSKQKKATPVAGLACAKLPSSARILAAGANSLRLNIAHPSPAKIRSDSAALGGRAARIVRLR